MIQRVQSIYLLLTLLCSAGLYFTSQDVVIFGNEDVVAGSGIGSGLLSLISIFSYKNRNKQMLFNRLNILINALLIGVLVYWLLTLSGGIDFPEKGIESLFPLISVVLLILANINIRKDERLVKSVDRFR